MSENWLEDKIERLTEANHRSNEILQDLKTATKEARDLKQELVAFLEFGAHAAMEEALKEELELLREAWDHERKRASEELQAVIDKTSAAAEEWFKSAQSLILFEVDRRMGEVVVDTRRPKV